MSWVQAILPFAPGNAANALPAITSAAATAPQIAATTANRLVIMPLLSVVPRPP